MHSLPVVCDKPLTARLQLLISASLERFVQNNIDVFFFVNDEAFPLSEKVIGWVDVVSHEEQRYVELGAFNLISQGPKFFFVDNSCPRGVTKT